MGIKVINIEDGKPSVEEARRRLIQVIDASRNTKYQVLKIIHGYGSSGVGGALKEALRKSLRYRKKEGKVDTYIYGEDWDVFDEKARQLLERFQWLKSDSDYSRKNPGITIIVLTPKR